MRPVALHSCTRPGLRISICTLEGLQQSANTYVFNYLFINIVCLWLLNLFISLDVPHPDSGRFVSPSIAVADHPPSASESQLH